MSTSAIKSFFNYLRGSEVDTDEQEKQSTSKSSLFRFESLKTFLKYTFRISSSLFPSCLSPPFFTFLALLVDVVVLEVVIYRVGLLSGEFFSEFIHPQTPHIIIAIVILGRYYKCLSNRDLDAFWSLTISAVSYIVINSALKSVKDFLASLLSIMWRKQLTQKLQDMYFSRMRFYYLQISNNNGYDDQAISSNVLVVDNNSQNEVLNASSNNLEPKLKRLDNPDQRITQDVNNLCISLASIIPLLLITPFVIGWYGYQVQIIEFIV